MKSRKTNQFILIAAITALLSANVFAQDKAKSTTTPVKVTSVEGITEYKLSNGLRVLLFPDPSKST
ncbi:MAG TPA: hypothetical protein PKX86_07765, partial [Bacteroidia bacterium]|nr:hypothetical protein [Bacteroidia bacterium]